MNNFPRHRFHHDAPTVGSGASAGVHVINAFDTQNAFKIEAIGSRVGDRFHDSSDTYTR